MMKKHEYGTKLSLKNTYTQVNNNIPKFSGIRIFMTRIWKHSPHICWLHKSDLRVGFFMFYSTSFFALGSMWKILNEDFSFWFLRRIWHLNSNVIWNSEWEWEDNGNHTIILLVYFDSQVVSESVRQSVSASLCHVSCDVSF